VTRKKVFVRMLDTRLSRCYVSSFFPFFFSPLWILAMRRKGYAAGYPFSLPSDSLSLITGAVNWRLPFPFPPLFFLLSFFGDDLRFARSWFL